MKLYVHEVLSVWIKNGNTCWRKMLMHLANCRRPGSKMMVEYSKWGHKINTDTTDHLLDGKTIFTTKK